MTRAGRRKLGTKGAFGLASMAIAAVGVCRVAVLYLEAVSAVRADRQADLELLELCASGHARGSPKMREACLKAQAERAAPIVLKALMRSCSIAWREFLVHTGSPFKLFLVLLCVLSAFVVPVMPMLRVLCGVLAGSSAKNRDSDSESDDEALVEHFIDMSHQFQSSGGMRRRLRRLLPKLALMPATERQFDELERQKSGARLLQGPEWSEVSLHAHRD
jgi:hypothetical protein